MVSALSVLSAVLLLVSLPWRPVLGDLKGMMMNYALDSMGVNGAVSSVKSSLDVVQKTRQGFLGSLTSASKSVTSNFNSYVMDKVDEHGLESIFAQQIANLPQPFGKSSCLMGVKGKQGGTGTLTLTNGKLNNRNKMQVYPKIMQEVDDKSLLVLLSFGFSDLTADFNFQFENDGYIGRDRQGTLQLLISGPNYVNVTAMIPKSRSDINNYLSQKTCFLNVREVQAVLGPTIKVSQVEYGSIFKSTFGVGVTEISIKAVVSYILSEIQVNLKQGLRNVVAPALAKETLFCKSRDTTPEDLRCSDVRNV